MGRSPCVLFAVLVYVTLDLSLPSMPGAFVFEPSESIETIQTSRARSADAVAGSPGLAPQVAAVIAERGLASQSIRSREAANAPLRRRIESRSGRPRTIADPPPSSEDPH